MDLLAAISALCGWVYTAAWSLSFYPQPLLNARRRSTAGTTVDFPLINSLGFLAYLVSTAALRYSRGVRAEYAARHHGLTPTVAANDVVFAAHALVLSLVTLSQYWVWGGEGGAVTRVRTRMSHQHCSALSSTLFSTLRSTLLGTGIPPRPSRFILGLMAGCVVGVGVVVVLASTRAALGWLDVVYALGYVKLVVTLVKYSPQVLANWRNRSTAGWSIAQIVLDAAGGLLSIAQLLLDSYRQGDWSGVTGNPVKLALGNVSMAYDAVFLTQHYVLYGEGRRGGTEGEGEGEDGGEGGRATG